MTARRLAVISHTPHHHGPDGLVGWGPTVTELSHLATRFDSVVHVAPVHDGPPPASALPYTADNVTVVPVRAAGGDGLAKVSLAAAVPGWLAAMHRGTKGADVLHVRCPANLSGLALAVLRARRDRRPLWVKYAGNWRPDEPEAWSYRTQRRWLRKGWGTIAVTVNGRGDEPPHVRAFDNPSLTDDDLARGAAASKGEPLRLAFVGRVEPEKGAVEAARVAALVRATGRDVHLTVVGDGPDLDACRAADPEAELTGWLPREGVHDVLAEAHVLLLPSRASEGWPKVLSEAMAFGAIPVASTVSSIPQVFAETGAGVAVEGTDPADHAEAVLALLADPARVDRLRAAGRAAAPRWSFAAYLAAVEAMFDDRWGIRL